MSVITIADRRAIMASSVSRPDFRDLMRRDPRAAFQEATGSPAPQEARFNVIEEGPDAWEFVVPAGTIEAEIPSADDARGVIENGVYGILRDEPEVRAGALRDPKRFLAERLNLDMPDVHINVREEQEGEIVLILPYGDSRDELNDAALDLVAGGGNVPVQGGVPIDPEARGGESDPKGS